MKYTNFILTLIFLVLLILATRIADLRILLSVFNENTQTIGRSNAQIIEVNRELVSNLKDLKAQLQELSAMFK